MGCDSQDSCIQVGANGEFGLDHLEKIRLVSSHAKELRLTTTNHEVAAIVGAAYALSQIEGGQSGVPVRICLRSGNEGHTEYRVLSTQGIPLSVWQSTATFKVP